MVLITGTNLSKVTIVYLFFIGTVSSDGGITNPNCGDKQSYSLPRGKGVSFFCRPVLYGRYVTIRSLRTDKEHFTLCEVEVYSERRGSTLYVIVQCKLLLNI